MSKLGRAKRLTGLPKPHHTAVMAEIVQQTDRGAAIVGGAYVDSVLREAITERMGAPDDIDSSSWKTGGRFKFSGHVFK
jgi:hypothetical protein